MGHETEILAAVAEGRGRMSWHDRDVAETGDVRRFESRVSWNGDASGSGTAEVAGGFAIPIAGAVSLGGSGAGANPEEMLLASIGACFVNTWAIFLKKLSLAHPEPEVRVSGELGTDPAGGFRMEGVTIHARVPAPLLSSSRAAVEKTLGLAEKYCILSKVARAAMPVRVEIEEIPASAP
jgi:lipoyl-dependent peroxiredoxin